MIKHFGHDGVVGQPYRTDDLHIPGLRYAFRLAYGHLTLDRSADLQGTLDAACILVEMLDAHAAEMVKEEDAGDL